MATDVTRIKEVSWNATRVVDKRCPKCGGPGHLFAGDGMYDFEIICRGCGFTVHRNSRKATIERWNVATARAKSEE